MKLVNLTPHAITFLDGENNPVLTVEPSGVVARAAQTRTLSGEIAGIPVNQCAYGEVQGLPEPAPETAYIVSALTAQACPERKDVYIVDDTIRDGNGRIVGCRALAHIWAGENQKVRENYEDVKFISYTGKATCLCSGDLCMEIAGKTYTFGFGESWWESGGSCWYANGETGHDEGPWRLNERRLPEALRPYAAEMLAEFNANVRPGCCGGCE